MDIYKQLASNIHGRWLTGDVNDEYAIGEHYYSIYFIMSLWFGYVLVCLLVEAVDGTGRYYYLTPSSILLSVIGEKYGIIQHIATPLVVGPLVILILRNESKSLQVISGIILVLAVIILNIDGGPHVPGYDMFKSPGFSDPHFLESHIVAHVASIIIPMLFIISKIGDCKSDNIKKRN